MRHIVALLVKSVLVLGVLFVVLTLMYDYPFSTVFALTLLIVGLSYVIGDLGILPMTNNTVATLADIGLCTAKIWLLSPLVGYAIPFFPALVASIGIGVGEWFFHKFMHYQVLPRKEAM